MQVIFTGAITFPFGIMSARLTHAAPTLETLVGRVATALRDSDLKTFKQAEIIELIRAGFIEVGGVYPKEAEEWVQLVDSTYTYGTTIEDVWRVEVVTPENVISVLRPYDDEPRDGWEIITGTLSLLDSTSFNVDANPVGDTVRMSDGVSMDGTRVRAGVVSGNGDYLHLYGYLPRQAPDELSDVCDVDGKAEMGVTKYAALTGLQRLAADRALFSQWVTDSGNTDISPTQLLGMVDVFDRQWQQVRRQLKMLRRAPG